MLVVVTGATGFLGHRLHTWLESFGLEVVGAARRAPSRTGLVPFDPRSDAFLRLLSRGPNVLVHAAGGSLIDGSFSDPKQDFLSNTDLYFDVLEAVRQFAPACQVVLISSAAVYGNPTSQPVSESTTLAPISPYGYHKAMAEELGQMYHRIFGLRTCAVRVFSAYGPGLRRQVVYDAIRMLRASRPGHPAVFRGTGQETRDFIHVDDVARGVNAVIQGARWTGEAYNLASGDSSTIADLVEMVRSLLGTPSVATFDGVPARGHPLAWQADISRIRALGFAPAWTLQRGVADLVDSWGSDQPSGPE
jgi:UDP-glucose 4-epimerase